MSPHGPQAALGAILEAIDGIAEATRGKTLEHFQTEWLLRHGVQRGIEIISEATRRVPANLQATQPGIPWSEIVAIGNVLRHEYHRVSDRIVWNVVAIHLPPLRQAAQAILASLGDAAVDGGCDE